MENLKTVSREEFDKRVQMEAAHLEYMDRLKPSEAHQKATEEISQKYQVLN